jgi:hydroxymethylglutaryl-CoA reductase (NADPH)
VKHRWQQQPLLATIPLRRVGPVLINSSDFSASVLLPLATLEAPLWPATQRGATTCNQAGGLSVAVIRENMTRSVVVSATTVSIVAAIAAELPVRLTEMQAIVSLSSNYAQLITVQPQVVGSLLYLRFVFTTADAAGHNMATLAAERLLEWLLAQYQELAYVAISGNFCTDKKVSAVNSILGRGKYVVAEVNISAAICQRFLKTTPAKIVDLHIKKNLLGSIIAGSINSANAHFANMLLAIYLATGQDVANIVEGSQGLVHAELRDTSLYFSVTLPNIIVGTVGNGKDLPFVRDNLQLLGCLQADQPGQNARRLAIIVAAAVLCGELSLLAAQTNPGELMRTHLELERKTNA